MDALQPSGPHCNVIGSFEGGIGNVIKEQTSILESHVNVGSIFPSTISKPEQAPIFKQEISQ